MSEGPYVGRGGLKLRHALDEFGIHPSGWVCADLGCNVGGFTDCLLHAGAAKVYAVDTGYGALAWKLRQDARVVVMERTNALHVTPPELVELVVMDLGWTPQRHAIPAALKWLKEGGRIVTLIKPHYEASRDQKALLRGGVLEEVEAERVVERVLAEIQGMGLEVRGVTRSPVIGGAGKGKRGNVEWLAVVGMNAGTERRTEGVTTGCTGRGAGGEGVA
jgi:23S rRNA (cytidine1920-2'-O)/16S rRNA (cytidine1409-2'-O)-methyltransferase